MADEPVAIEPVALEPECRKPIDYVLWKLDRNMAIVGIIGIGILSLYKVIPQDSQQLAGAAITALATYVGIRSGK
jgi:hypothetical protein